MKNVVVFFSSGIRHFPLMLYEKNYNVIRRAGRSVVDRYLGMVEAAGSIPARSTGSFTDFFIF